MKKLLFVVLALLLLASFSQAQVLVAADSVKLKYAGTEVTPVAGKTYLYKVSVVNMHATLNIKVILDDDTAKPIIVLPKGTTEARREFIFRFKKIKFFLEAATDSCGVIYEISKL